LEQGLKAVGDGGIATECFGYVWIGIGRGGTSRGGWPWRDYFENLHLRIVRMLREYFLAKKVESCTFLTFC
jgi:hypothetical protein